MGSAGFASSTVVLQTTSYITAKKAEGSGDYLIGF